MNFKKLEKEVIENAAMLEPMMKGLVGKHKGKFVLFNKGTIDIMDDFGEAIKAGITKYGKNTGFVVDEITLSIPILSCLVKL